MPFPGYLKTEPALPVRSTDLRFVVIEGPAPPPDIRVAFIAGRRLGNAVRRKSRQTPPAGGLPAPTALPGSGQTIVSYCFAYRIYTQKLSCHLPPACTKKPAV